MVWVRGCHSTQGQPPVPPAGWEGVGSGSSCGSLASCSVDWVQEAGTRPSLDSYSSSRSGHQNQDNPPPWPLSPRTGEGWRQEPKRGAVSLLSVSPWGPVRQAAVPTAPVSWAGGKGKFNESRCFSDWLWAQCKCSGRQGGVCEVGLEDGAIKKASFFF